MGRKKAKPLLLKEGMFYKIHVGPLSMFKGTFIKSSKKGYNFDTLECGKLFKTNIYPDKKCISLNGYQVFWLPVQYRIVDKWGINVNNFTYQNYNVHWRKNENLG